MESPKRYISDKTVGGFIYVLSIFQKTQLNRLRVKGFTSVSKEIYRKLVPL